MLDRAGIDGGTQSSRIHSGMAGWQLFRILGQDTSGWHRTSSGYSQSLAVRKYFQICHFFFSSTDMSD